VWKKFFVECGEAALVAELFRLGEKLRGRRAMLVGLLVIFVRFLKMSGDLLAEFLEQTASATKRARVGRRLAG
jgi:hypothetical protein